MSLYRVMEKEVGIDFDPTTVVKKDNIAEAVLRRYQAVMLDRYYRIMCKLFYGSTI